MRPVIGFHLVMTCYGFWLPNDPRGSGSKRVWAKALRRYGDATYTSAERSVADRKHDATHRLLAKTALRHPPVLFNGLQAKHVVTGLAALLLEQCTPCFACAVMPDHVHLVIARPDEKIDRVMIKLKSAAVKRLLAHGLHPFQRHAAEGKLLPKLWARGGRHVFLYDREGVSSCIQYVQENPVKAGLPAQKWSFVVPFR